MSWKAYLPSDLKIGYQLIKRYWRDRRITPTKVYATSSTKRPILPVQLCVQQEIKRTAAYAEKVHNFRLAIAKTESIVIAPEEVFSFWKSTGRPSRNNGFQAGRTLINGELQLSVGGGLCQIAGLLYAIALQAGMEILERHAHSIDIYTEDTRYAPLGSDATVVYGYKDFQFRNTSGQTIYFTFIIDGDWITIQLHAAKEIIARAVTYQIYSETLTKVQVMTLVDGREVVRSSYQRI